MAHSYPVIDLTEELEVENDAVEVMDLTMSSRSSSSQSDDDSLTSFDTMDPETDPNSPTRLLSLTKDDARRLLRGKRVLFAGNASMRLVFRDVARFLEDGCQMTEDDLTIQHGQYEPMRGLKKPDSSRSTRRM